MENPGDGFCWTETRVVVGTLANDFAFDSILLVSEGDSDISDIGEGVHVIQEGSGWADVGSALVGESDVFELEGLGAQLGVVGMEELARAHEPEEAGDGELEDVFVEETMIGVVEVEPIMHGLDEGEANGIHPGLGAVVAFESFDEVAVDR